MSLVDFYTQRQFSRRELTPLRPIWSPIVDGSKVKGGKLSISDEEFIEWFKATRPVLEYIAQPYFEDAWANILWFTGDYLPSIPLVVRTDAGQELRIPRQLAPLAINYTNFLTSKRVAELAIYKPTHDTKPEDETSAEKRIIARVMKKMIERSKRNNQLDTFFNLTEKANMIGGSVFASIDWNPHKGDYINGNPSEREGATVVRLKHMWHVVPWRSRTGFWEDVPCIFEVDEVLHVEEARKKYDNKDIQPFPDRNLFTFQSPFVEEVSADEVVIWRVVYKPDEYLPYGAVYKTDGERVLAKEVNSYPWGHRDFPVERYTDIDVTGRLFPMSFYQNIKPLQHTFNNLSGLLKRYIFTLAHPKFIHQRGSVNDKALGNTPSLIGVKPGTQILPSIMQVKSIGSDPFNFRGILKDEMVMMSDTHKLSLGDLPSNTRSGTMISRLREIENQQRGPQIDKKNEFMRRVLLKMGAVDAERIPLTSKAHIERIVGKELVPEVLALKDVNVSAQYELIIVNSTGFSAEMTGRIAELAALENEAKVILTPQEKRDILGGVLREKHYDVMTAARYACQQEIEMMNDGKEPFELSPTDDLTTYWSTLLVDMQSVSHKRLPPKIQERKKRRLLAIESMIEEIIEKNPIGILAEKVKLLEGFPRLYNLKPENEVAPPPATPSPLPMGLPVNGEIPLAPGGGVPPTADLTLNNEGMI